MVLSAPYCYVIILLSYCHAIFFLKWLVFLHQVKCTHCIMQTKSHREPRVVNPILQTPSFKEQGDNNIILWDLFCLLWRLLWRQRALCGDDS